MKSAPEWLERWRVNPRRWDKTALLALPAGARVFEDGVMVRRTTDAVAWWIVYRTPLAAGSRRTRKVLERLPACTNKTQALGVLALRRSEVFTGTYRPKTKEAEMTLSELAEKFFAARRHLETVEKYREHYDKHVEPFFGATTPIVSITRERVEAFYAKKLDERAIASANYYFATLRAMFRMAIERDIIDRSPCAGVKLKKPNNRRERMLTAEEAGKLLEAAHGRDDHVGVLFVLLFGTGMRLSEALRLEWTDIELDRQMLRIRKAKSGEGRWVHLAESTAKELESWRKRVPASTWVFPGPDPKHHMTEVKKGWASLCAVAGVQVGRHELRHNFVSHALAAGYSPADIMPGTGHKTIRAFEGYAHTLAERRRAVAESAAALLEVGAARVRESEGQKP